jgi:hypothetical protein
MGLFKPGGFIDRWRVRVRADPVIVAEATEIVAKHQEDLTKRRARDRVRKKQKHVPLTDRIRWDNFPEANQIILDHYATTKPEVIAAMVAPYFPNHFISKNRIIGRANRLGLGKPHDS